MVKLFYDRKSDNMKILRKVIYYLLIIVCIIGMIFSLYNIIIWVLSVNENKKIKSELDSSITIIEKKDEDEIDNDAEIIDNKEYIIDFDKLKETNKDTVGYLEVKNTNISYVVVRGKDNSYYLTHNFNKKYNVAGWIYTDYKNKVDGTDRNLVIFGHNTRDNSMFGTLKYTQKKDWQEDKDNWIITFVTEKGKDLYQVFSTYTIDPEEYYINTEFKNDIEFFNFVKTLKSRSNYDYGVDVNENDQILTLSSCTPGGAQRVVLHAKKIYHSDDINEKY